MKILISTGTLVYGDILETTNKDEEMMAAIAAAMALELANAQAKAQIPVNLNDYLFNQWDNETKDWFLDVISWLQKDLNGGFSQKFYNATLQVN